MKDFQEKFSEHIAKLLGNDNLMDNHERNQRVLEETLELIQANGGTKQFCHDMVDWVFETKEVGDVNQELGGVLCALATLATANGLDMDEERERSYHEIVSKGDKLIDRLNRKPVFPNK